MNEQELRQAMAAMETYKAQSEALMEQQQLLQMSLEDNSRAKDTLNAIAQAGENEDVLMPIGGSSFVYAKVSSNKKVLIGIGTGLTMEKPIQEAVDTVSKRVEELMDALKKVQESRTVLEMKMQQISQTLQSEYQRMQQQGMM